MQAMKSMFILYLALFMCSASYGYGTTDPELRGPLPAATQTESAPMPAPAPARAPASSASSTSSAGHLLQENIVKSAVTAPTASAAPPDNSVEAFFQVGASRNGAQSLSMQAATVTSAADNKSKSRSGFSRCMWHILDNAGIPLPDRHDTDYIDPNIKSTYLIPSPTLASEGAVAKELEQTTAAASKPGPQSTATNSAAALQKIPVSELEGVPLPALRDEINAPRP